MLNIGIVGPGRVADTRLAPALKQLTAARLWSVIGRDLTRVEAFAARHEAHARIPAHTDLAAALQDPDLDAVIIATRDELHAPQATASARAAKHVLVEKPLATSAAEGRAMVEAARATGVVLAVGYHLRWHDGHRRLVDALRRDVLGKLLHMRVQWTDRTHGPENWRATGKDSRWWALSAFGTHCLDLIRWFMVPGCGEVTNIACVSGSPKWHSRNEETSVVAMRFHSGATSEFLTSVLLESERRIEIWGQDGRTVCLDTLGPDGAGHISLAGQEMPFSVRNPYIDELQDFVASIQTSRKPEVDGAEGLQNLELLQHAVAGSTGE